MFKSTMLAAAVAATVGIFGFGGASSAAPATFGGPEPIVGKSTNIELAQSRRAKARRWYYNRGVHGPRYRYRSDRYRYRYGGWWYPRPWWGYGSGIAIGIGPGYGGGAYVGGGGGHVRWCLNHYRSYNPRTNTFVGYDGYRHACRSPYRG